MQYEIWKKVRQKAGLNPGWSRQKACVLPPAPLKMMLNWRRFYFWLTQSHVGGRS